MRGVGRGRETLRFQATAESRKRMLAVPSGNARGGRGAGEGGGFDRSPERVAVKWRLVLNVIKARSLITKRALLIWG